MPYLEFEGEVRPLGPGVLTVGSAPEASWRIQGRGLDPIHALLSVETGGRALLIRRAPSATVLVNGVELVPFRTLLSFGDGLRLAAAELRYRRLAPGAGAPTAYLRDTRRGRLYQLRERSSIGRETTSTVVVHEPDVSRLHAEILQRGEAYLLVPHGVSVTSVNRDRLIAPTALQEGDEIAIGRTVLRFTTALPTGSEVSAEPATRGNRAARVSQMQTTFMGVIEARDQRSRVTRRRITRLAAAALVTVAMAALVATLFTDSHAPIRRRPGDVGRSTRRHDQGADLTTGDPTDDVADGPRDEPPTSARRAGPLRRSRRPPAAPTPQ